MKLIKDLGMLYGSPNSKRKRRYGVYECSKCNKHIELLAQNAKKNKHKMCKSCSSSIGNSTHGGTGTRLHNTWKDMKQRCSNPKNKEYVRYGEKGVSVTEEWLDFSTFKKWAISNGYEDDLTIDRINSNGNYEPNNCRWLSNSDNSRRASTRDTYDNGNKVVKISQDEASEICEAYESGVFSQREIAEHLHVSQVCISLILKCRRDLL